MSTKIVVVDDHKMFREGLVLLLEKEPDFKVVGQAADGKAVLRLASTLKPDVVITDITMPEINGVETTRHLKEVYPQVKVIGLSMHAENRFVVEMLQAGASGYVLKHCASEELVEAIRAVCQGENYLSPNIAGAMVKEYVMHHGGHEASVFTRLTERERQVLQLLADGYTAKKAASCLHLSPKTIATHREHIMEKLDLHNLAELTKYAIREGLTTAEVPSDPGSQVP